MLFIKKRICTLISYNSIQTILYMFLYKLPRTVRTQHAYVVKSKVTKQNQSINRLNPTIDHQQRRRENLDVWTSANRMHENQSEGALWPWISGRRDPPRTALGTRPEYTPYVVVGLQSPPTINPMAAGSRCWGCRSRTTAPPPAAAGTAAGASRR
jgi:hypothetical protein